MITVTARNSSVNIPPLKATGVHEMIMNLERWLVKEGLSSHDWWDLWATSLGGWAKSTFVKNQVLGSVGVVPLTLVDLVFPRVRRWFSEKRTFPICHSHIGLGFLNLYKLTNDPAYLDKAEQLVQPLLDMASPQTQGLGWGMKHDWMTVQGLIPKDTPCNTQTAYAYEFFAELHEVTHNDQYASHLGRIAIHVANDFPEWYDGDRLACAYSMIDSRKVVNANTYRMMMLLEAGRRFMNKRYHDKGLATLRYVLSMQRPDGSWPYAEDQQFVDTYHTCFVLKNLSKARDNAPQYNDQIEHAIEKGFLYYFANLFDNRNYPIPFAVKPRMVLHTYDSYDLAESLGLLADLRREPDRVRHLLSFAADRFQTKEGWFRFRLYRGLPIKGMPYMRYANSAMFLALTKVLLMFHHSDAHGTADR
jgi:hypothetical protein